MEYGEIFESGTPEETYNLGKRIGEGVKSGEIYALNGDLGVGKTVFTKGFAVGLGIGEHITSPTFTIVNQYEGRFKFNHFDLYRLYAEEEMDDIGYEEYFFGGGVTLIEWAERFPNLIPSDTIFITIQKDFAKGDDYRRIILRSRDLRSRDFKSKDFKSKDFKSKDFKSKDFKSKDFKSKDFKSKDLKP